MSAYALTEPQDKTPRPSFLSIRLRSLRSGPINEILNEQFFRLVTPRSGDVMNVIRTTHHLNDDPVKFVSYGVHWKSEPQAAAETRTVLDVLGNVINTTGHNRYLLYEVSVTDGDKARTYRAMALFAGLLAEGMPGNIVLADEIVESSALGLALAEDGLPLRSPLLKFSETQQYRDLVDRVKRGQSLGGFGLQSLMRPVSFSISPGAGSPNPASLQGSSCPTGFSSDPYYGCCNDATLQCCFPYEWTGICGTNDYDAYCPCTGSGGGGETRDPNDPITCEQSDEWADPTYQDGVT